MKKLFIMLLLMSAPMFAVWTEEYLYFLHQATDLQLIIDAVLDENTTEEELRVLARLAFHNVESMEGATALHILATVDDYVPIVRLYNAGALINARDKRGRTPLHYAAQYNTKKVILSLLTDPDISLNAQTNAKYTPLHYALIYENYEIAKQLYNAGASVFLPDQQEKTALDYYPEMVHWADEIGETILHRISKNTNINQLLCLVYILQFEPEINAKNMVGNTPLHEAVINRSYKLIAILLNHGADLNAQNDQGSTPLHYAARDLKSASTETRRNEIWAAIKLMVDANADLSITNKKGETPRMLLESLFNE